jgi:hypothetical protein
VVYYITSFGVLFVYGVCLFWVSKYILNLDLVYSLIFTVIFYAGSITLLTIILIILRRWKIKRWIIFNIKIIKAIDKNSHIDIKYYDELDKICGEGDHKYLDMFKKDLTKYMDIDMNKYQKINIWKDENMNPKLK